MEAQYYLMIINLNPLFVLAQMRSGGTMRSLECMFKNTIKTPRSEANNCNVDAEFRNNIGEMLPVSLLYSESRRGNLQHLDQVLIIDQQQIQA